MEQPKLMGDCPHHLNQIYVEHVWNVLLSKISETDSVYLR